MIIDEGVPPFMRSLESVSDHSNRMVSADFLRLNGSRQQFRNLLSARKKLGTMPPAYTRIDISRESIDSNGTFLRECCSSGFAIACMKAIEIQRKPCFDPVEIYGIFVADGGCFLLVADREYRICFGTTQRFQAPTIKVQDTGSQLKISTNKSSSVSLAIDSQKSSVDKETITYSNNANHVSFERLNRNNSRYGVPIDSAAAKLVYRIRSERLKDRVAINDRCLIFAMIGILVMAIDSEITAQLLFAERSSPRALLSKESDTGTQAGELDKSHPISLMLRTLVAFSTLLLVSQIVRYHMNEIKLELVDCGADDWRVVMSLDRITQFASEIIICSVCPLPGSGHLNWTIMESTRIYRVNRTAEVPLDVVLSLLMLGRVYLVGRFMVLHSKQFQDASTRTLAALNRIQVNFSFVMKTVLDQEPIRFLTAFTLIFWMITAWTFVQCERFGRDESPSLVYSNALWFVAITFMLNGYGDIVPQTQCGRIIAIFVGVVVNIPLMHFKRMEFVSFRHIKSKIRAFNEISSTSLDQVSRLRVLVLHVLTLRGILVARDEYIEVFIQLQNIDDRYTLQLVTEMHSSMQRLVSAQEEMRAQIEVLQRAMRNHFTHQNQFVMLSELLFKLKSFMQKVEELIQILILRNFCLPVTKRMSRSRCTC
ncbi:unnamed protein product [Anisakis simplex]|uniref:Potassium channel domain-containing protein n=1 Tax=Anisakis simplex TaxID=6269 RepID=A0A3P6QZZ4_ANISI|nr:unnamed protein product [Anisakis simplex]